MIITMTFFGLKKINKMHPEVKSFIKYARKKTLSKYWMRSFFRFKNVLECGSLDINGTVRDFFWFCRYVGVDIHKGKGVDIVAKISELDFIERFDTVISCEMLEHDKEWETSLEIMYDLVRPKGLLVITCAAPDREPHGLSIANPGDSPATNDYYRNISMGDFRRVLPKELFSYYQLQYCRGQNDLQFYGIKK